MELKKAAHRTFGYVAVPVLLAHIVASMYLLVVDVAKHRLVVKMLLFSDMVACVYYVVGGIYYQRLAKEHPKDSLKYDELNWMHRTMSFFGFLYSIEGAGTIRFTTWVTGLVSMRLP